MDHAIIVAGASVVFMISVAVIAFVMGQVVGRQRAFRDLMQSKVRDIRDGRS
jgi:hypothetical protein